jgi:hypothetical protein
MLGHKTARTPQERQSSESGALVGEYNHRCLGFYRLCPYYDVLTLQEIDLAQDMLKGRKVAILVTDGFEWVELVDRNDGGYPCA